MRWARSSVISAALLAAVLFSPIATANIVTPSGAYAGTMAPWDKDTFEGRSKIGQLAVADGVSLTQVRLSLDVFPMFVRVDATFTLRSSADDPIIRQVGIPVRPFGGKGIGGVPLDDLVIQAGPHLRAQPRPVATEVCVSHTINPGPNDPFHVVQPGPNCRGGVPTDRRWWVWSIELPPDRPVVTRVRYLQLLTDIDRYGGELKSYMVQALGSAAAWAGPIGEISMEVRLHGVDIELDSELDPQTPLAPIREGNVLRWHLTKFEPSVSDTLGFSFTSTMERLGGRTLEAPYLPQDIDRRLRMQDYLMRFVAADDSPTSTDWQTLVEGLRQVLDDEKHPVSQAWAHGTLLALRDWAVRSMSERPIREIEPETDLDFADIAAIRKAEGQKTSDSADASVGIPASPSSIPPEAKRLFQWLTPAPLSADIQRIATMRPVNLRRRGGLYPRRWKGAGAQTLIDAADEVYMRRLLMYGGWGGAAMLAVFMGLWSRRRRSPM